jgi:hypothetical protein
MSKHLSEARAAFELANSSLEDVLIVEMRREKGEILGIVTNLQHSVQEIVGLRKSMADLLSLMRKSGYKDLPTLHTIDLATCGKSFAKEGFVTIGAWMVIENLMTSGGFYRVLDRLDADAMQLSALTDDLRECILALNPVVEKGGLTEIVERNHTGNLKVPFARLYAKWEVFQGLFLASSMLSTELWYAFNHDGSILDLGMDRASVA